MNTAVGSKLGEEEISFWGKTFKCKVNTLQNILAELKIEKIDFIKMDIEGFEIDVMSNSIHIIKEANVISLECHGTKQDLDKKLLPYGFVFEPITYPYYYRKILKNLFLHPLHLYRAGVDTIKKNPKLLHRTLTRYDLSKDEVIQGSYLKCSGSN